MAVRARLAVHLIKAVLKAAAILLGGLFFDQLIRLEDKLLNTPQIMDSDKRHRPCNIKRAAS